MKIRMTENTFRCRETGDHRHRNGKVSVYVPASDDGPDGTLHQMLQDTLRGPALASMPFYDQKKVITLLDKLPAMSDLEQVGWDPVLMSLLSACVIQERFGLGSRAASDEAATVAGPSPSKSVTRKRIPTEVGLESV
jgi:hypothetical protein